ncbi:MAG: TM0996/MTH895 family glutaredoxin-like protein [Anaerolineae bacterium]|nr:TM0996/MTH895 family glutaredoxin-like protein [Anaerolineae bacterium]
MEIKILGGGCAKCERLEKLAREVVEELGVEATFAKVKDLDAITAYDIVSTPALVIDGEVRSSGRIPREEEIAAWIQAAR